MIRTVYKYQLQLNDTTEVTLPTNHQILKFGCQVDSIIMWCLVELPEDGEPRAGTVTRKFRIAGTGHPIQEGVTKDHYLDTVFMGRCVWHIFKLN